MNQIARIGHNNPPTPIELAQPVMAELSTWMGEHPVIENGNDASEAKRLLDSAKGCAGDIEAERDRLVRPLNEQIDEINASHKSVHNKDTKKPGTLDRVVNELKTRLAAFIEAEEARRAAEAQRLADEAAEAERLAREAENAEREAIENSKAGELGVDVTQVVIEADSRFSTFKKADRAAARAEKATHVKIGGGWGKSASLRTVETLILENYGKALKAIGPHDGIRDAILSAARDYRKQKGCLPEGVISETTRKL